MRVLILTLLCYWQLNAQSIGIEYGVSGTQNYGIPENTMGLSFSMKLNDRVSGYASYLKWNGEDDNYTYSKKYPGTLKSSLGFYGNVGLNLSLHYKYYSREQFNFYSGFGFGHYKMFNRNSDDTEYDFFISAILITPLFVEWNINDTYSIYSKGLLGFKPNEIAPDWGSLVFGVSYNPF